MKPAKTLREGNKDAKIYIGRFTTVHNVLFLRSHTSMVSWSVTRTQRKSKRTVHKSARSRPKEWTKICYRFSLPVAISKQKTNGITYYLGGTISIEAIKLFEGDLVLTPPQREAAKQGRDIIAGVSRGASKNYLWPSGVVHYSVEQQLSKYYHSMDMLWLKFDFGVKFYKPV